jgi:hypothetical protein
MSRRGGVRVVPVLLAGALAVAACSGDDDALPSETTPAATPTDTATVEPTPTEPTDDPTPDVDPTPDLEAEITEFFEEYIEAVNESWASEDALLQTRDMFADTCDSCAAVYALATEAHDRGWSYKGAPGSLDGIQLTSYQDGVAVFTAETSSSEATLVDARGEVVRGFVATNGLQVVYQAARNDANEWVLIRDEVL